MSVIVYGTKTCPWCAKAKDYLNNKQIEYTDIDVGLDRQGAIEMVRKSGQRGVPVLDIDGNIVIGFNQEQIDKYLKLA